MNLLCMNAKRFLTCLLACTGASILLTGYSPEDFSLAKLKNYKKEFKSESIGACSTSDIKTYEDYRMITSVGSAQYQYIHNHCTVDDETGFLIDEDGFIGVALAYNFGAIGSRYYFILDTGITIPVVKVDAKASVHASNGCSADSNGHVLEFVIDSDRAMAYFGGANGLAASGNFNNYECLNGAIADIEKVSDEPIETGIIYTSFIGADLMKSTEEGDRIRMVKGGFRN